MRIPILIWLALFAVASATPVAAQSPFSPVARVNDRIVTGYELEQRILLNRLLRAPGNIEELSLEQLIDDRLRLDAAQAGGITIADEQVEVGMEEFAGRAQLSSEEFVRQIGLGGVEETTFRDFVEAGLAWREVVRTRFLPRVQISEAEIDRAISLASGPGGVRVLISEIILPADTPANAARAEALAARLSQINTLPAFAAAARANSASPSRGRGGRLDWLPLTNLPPVLRAQILTLKPGEVSDPIPIPNAIALFQMRAIEEIEAPETDIVAIEYASFLIPGGQSASAQAEAAKVRDRVDSCDDLYGVAKGLPEERLERTALPVDEIPGDVALELARLDEGESSTALTRANGETLVFSDALRPHAALGRRTVARYGSPESDQSAARILCQRAFGRTSCGCADRDQMNPAPIALTCGEPGGIGLEIASKAWAEIGRETPFFLIGDTAHFEGRANFVRIASPEEAMAAAALPILQHDFPAPADPGFADPTNAQAVIDVIARGVELTHPAPLRP